MVKNIIIKKCTSFLIILIILFQQFQSYVYASGISKLTNTIYNSSQNTSKSLKLDQKNKSFEKGVKKAIAQEQSNKSVVSDAYNYKSLSQTVDPRTGALYISFKIGDIIGNGFEDPLIPLSINYNSLSNTDIYSLGKGWAWNLTHFDTRSGMLILGNGGSYKVDFGTGKLKYYKIKDLIVSISRDLITLKYKDGHIEQIDRAFGNLQKYINVEGYSANFHYEMGARLKSIVYNNILNNTEIKKLEINYPSNYEVWINRNIGPNEISRTILKKSKDNLLTSIYDALGQETKFSYKSLPEKEFNTESLITDILYPTGTSINVIYLPGGLSSARKGFTASAVSLLRTTSLPRSENNEEEISYTYYGNTKSNYLAYGFSGYKEGEDTLFFTPNDYTYSTSESKKGPNNKLILTERVYNHFHQLINENLRVNGELFQAKEFIYTDWKNKSFDSLDDNYNFPKEVRLSYYSNGKKRTEITKQEYDSNGNILKTQDVSGVIKEYFYLDSDKTFNKIKHLPLREIEYSINGSGYKIIDYIYEQANNYQGILIQRLKAKIYKLDKNLCKINDKNCGDIYKIESQSYVKNSGVITFALPTYTKLYVLSNKKCKAILKKQEYYIKKDTNEFTRNVMSKDGNILAKEVNITNSYTNLEEKKIDVKGVETFYKYDVLGRVISEVIKPNSNSSQFKTTYSFKINDNNYGGYGKSSVSVQKSNGYTYTVVYDSLGRELEKYTLNNNGSMNKVISYSYGNVGQKTKETIFNSDQNGNLLQYSIHYKYDFLGREIQMISPSGESKITNYDDVNLTQESYIIATDGELSPISITTFNENKKPIKVQLLKSNRSLYSQSFKKFDDYGNVTEAIDINGNKTKYIYNLLGQKLEEIFSDGRRIKYEYDPIFESKTTKKSVILKDRTEYILGINEFNILGQLINYIDTSGNITKYEYDNKGNLITQIYNSGKVIKYLYNPLNQLYNTPS